MADDTPPLAELQRAMASQLVAKGGNEEFLKGEVNEGDLERFRETLIRKRISQTRGCLPLSTKRLGEQYVTMFRKFAENYQPYGDKAILQEAYDFARYLIQQLGNEHNPSIEIRGIVGLLEYESLMVRWQLNRCFFVRCNLDIRIMSWIQRDLDGDPEFGKTKVTAWRLGRWGHVRWKESS
jgi:hypothetical protein